MKKYSKILVIILCISLLSCAVPVFGADTGSVISITSAEDLLKMKDNPTGSYSLDADIDLKGIEWEPFEFSGSLEGNNHYILNVTIKDIGDCEKTVYDANLKEYDGLVCGFFSALSGATVQNLQLFGVTIDVDTNKSAFIGALAGYAEDTIVENCNIIGSTEISTSGHCFGSAGAIGFVKDCSFINCYIEAMPVCNDKDPNYMDEQFLGGVYAFGYANITDCKIVINGYASDRGYVHTGGLVGTFMYYDDQDQNHISITNNYVSGKITFFEDNEDRRAYCEPFIGEIMNWAFVYEDNSEDFTRNEVDPRDFDLTPHCECYHSLSTLTAASRSGKCGYTLDSCDYCGYQYKHDFTLPLEGEIVNPMVQDFLDPLVGETDLLVFSSHADDEQLFFAGILPYYSQVRDLAVQVVYCTDHVAEPERHEERKNGLWAVGIYNEPDTSGWYDLYANSIEEALANLMATDGVTEEDVIQWMREKINLYKPKVIITHDVDGEYGHGYHQMICMCLQECIDRYSSEFTFLKKVYLHLYDKNTITLDLIDIKYAELGGLTPFQVTQQFGFPEHYTQQDTWFYSWLYYGNCFWETPNSTEITKAYQIKSLSPLYWGLYYGDASLDQEKDDLFEGLLSYKEEEAQKEAEQKEKEQLEKEKAEREAAQAARKKKIIKTILYVIGGLFAAFVLLVIVLRTINKAKRRKKRRKKK